MHLKRKENEKMKKVSKKTTSELLSSFYSMTFEECASSMVSAIGIDPDKMIKFMKKYKEMNFSVKPRKKGNPIVTFDVTFDPREIHENDFRKSFNEDVMELLSDSSRYDLHISYKKKKCKKK